MSIVSQKNYELSDVLWVQRGPVSFSVQKQKHCIKTHVIYDIFTLSINWNVSAYSQHFGWYLSVDIIT